MIKFKAGMVKISKNGYLNKTSFVYNIIHLASPSQIEKVMHFQELFQEKGTLYLADPVMGDQGKFYSMVSIEFLEGMRKLSQMADVITPNLTELCFLSGVDYELSLPVGRRRTILIRLKVFVKRYCKRRRSHRR